jgi:hypothetical protein
MRVYMKELSMSGKVIRVVFTFCRLEYALYFFQRFLRNAQPCG